MTAMTQEQPQSKELTILIKLLKMTTSTHDHEAISAMRLANAQLLKLNTDWDDLLNGKVTLVADPFTAIPDVQAADAVQGSNRGRNQAPPRTTPPPPPPPPPLYHYNATEIQGYFDTLMFVTLAPNMQFEVDRAEAEFINTNKLSDPLYQFIRTLALSNTLKPIPRTRRRRTTP